MIRRRCKEYENDIPAEEKIKIQGSWIPGKNEDGGRKKGSRCKESKRKKGFNRIGRRYVAFFIMIYDNMLSVKDRIYDIFRIIEEIRGFSACL